MNVNKVEIQEYGQIAVRARSGDVAIEFKPQGREGATLIFGLIGDDGGVWFNGLCSEDTNPTQALQDLPLWANVALDVYHEEVGELSVHVERGLISIAGKTGRVLFAVGTHGGICASNTFVRRQE